MYAITRRRTLHTINKNVHDKALLDEIMTPILDAHAKLQAKELLERMPEQKHRVAIEPFNPPVQGVVRYVTSARVPTISSVQVAIIPIANLPEGVPSSIDVVG